jgi:hypothetical protein
LVRTLAFHAFTYDARSARNPGLYLITRDSAGIQIPVTAPSRAY